MHVLLNKHKKLEKQIEWFLDIISEAGILFIKGVEEYLTSDKTEFEDKLVEVTNKEHKADDLRRKIEMELYQKTLIPENRGDVLGLLENLDDVIDQIKETIVQLSIEHPDIPEEYHELYLKLATSSRDSVEYIICAVRAFFTDFNKVPEYLHLVHFYESDADKLSERLKRQIFASDLHLAHKNHLRYFALQFEKIADKAEAVADRLAIYTIKRQL